MSQPTPPESSNNHRSEPESPSFVKRGKLWVPETGQRPSLLERFWHWTGFKEKKLWDVLQLLIVPTALAIGAFYLQDTAKHRDQQLADDRTKQETLNRYFDQISTLLFEKKLRTAKEGSEARIVMRARTLTALRSLDGERKGQLIRFLLEADLLFSSKNGQSAIENEKRDEIFRVFGIRTLLDGANLDEANLSGTDLNGVNFSTASLNAANFDGANLESTSLHDTSLINASFIGANFSEVSFPTNIVGANFSKSYCLKASFAKANLSGASFKQAVLRAVDFEDANLTRADFSGAVLIETNLDEKNSFGSINLDAPILCKTTMPDGKISDRDCGKLKRPK